MDCYCVFGNSTGHSKPPLIHRLFVKQINEALVYDAQLTPLGDFPEFAQRFFEQGKGASITVPSKEEVYRLVDELNERAIRAGTVNTLIRLADGRLRDDNTSGADLLWDLMANAGVELRGKRALLLGIGDAVRRVLESFLGGCPAKLLIANRTARKTVDLAERFADLDVVRGCGFAEVEGLFDLVVNGTSVSLTGGVSPLVQNVIEPNCIVCCDMMYAKGPTALNRWAVEHGTAYILDGPGMLVEQAAEAFLLWCGVHSALAPVLETLHRQLITV